MIKSFLITGLCLLMLLPGVSQGTQEQDPELPDLELIEFLSTFNDEDSGWVDPMELLNMDEAELESAAGQEAGNEK